MQSLPDPAELARHYLHFRVAQRILLTGHSHQAWPDAALAGHIEAFTDAASAIDGKWELAFAKAGKLKAWFAERIGDTPNNLVLGPATHDLLVRLLSALPWRQRPRVVTTDGEFHSARRQLDRLAQEGIEVVKVPHLPVATLVDRVIHALDDRTAAVLVSMVGYSTGLRISHLDQLVQAARARGIATVVDAYHAFNVVEINLARDGLADAFVVAGGYKYAQMGEGNCFLRIPPGIDLQPVVTGWFAEFDLLGAQALQGLTPYPSGAQALAGSTYDPTSHYRGVAVGSFMAQQGLDVATLRAISQRQIGRLVAALQAIDLPAYGAALSHEAPLHQRAGFVGIETPHAAAWAKKLQERGILSDVRVTTLRLGPAPYVTDRQLDEAVATLREIMAVSAT